jgi:hypothetical protein
VSFIVIELEVVTIVPLVLTVLTLAVNVSGPSVVLSAIGLIVNDPEFEVIVKLPLETVKSEELVRV